MPTVNDIEIDYEPEIPEIVASDENEDISVNLEKNSLAEPKEGEEDEAAAVEGEEADSGEEGEDGEDKEEDPPKLVKEAYMTKAYYMPGYVDKTPQKDYPPHIRAFKDYIAQIGDFEKVDYEKEDYSPDTSKFAPDSSGFAPDSSSFAPDTSSFAPDTSNFAVTSGNYKAGVSGMSGPSSYRPEYGNFKPSVTHMRGASAQYRPTMQSSYRPQIEGYGNYRPAIGGYNPGFSPGRPGMNGW